MIPAAECAFQRRRFARTRPGRRARRSSMAHTPGGETLERQVPESAPREVRMRQRSPARTRIANRRPDYLPRIRAAPCGPRARSDSTTNRVPIPCLWNSGKTDTGLNTSTSTLRCGASSHARVNETCPTTWPRSSATKDKSRQAVLARRASNQQSVSRPNAARTTRLIG